MSKTRLEAFTDGVMAILITIMVLELHVPEDPQWSALRPLAPVFLAYVLSFIYLGIYWNNHHHMFQVVEGINGRVLWANSFLLFWLSLVPFATAWMGAAHFAAVPMAVYGVILLGAGAAYTIVVKTLLHRRLANPRLAEAIGQDRKGKLSLVCYSVAIPAAFLNRWFAGAIYVFVALVWLVPDQRIESKIPPQRRGQRPAG